MEIFETEAPSVTFEPALNIHQKLARIQNALKSPKDQKAQQYRYRNIEDINEAVKPLALEHECSVRYTDTFVFHDGRLVECMSTCYLCDGAATISATGSSIVNTSPKFMSIEQSCGAASSYARKYAACGLFAIDSSENDPDKVQVSMSDAPPADPLAMSKNALWRTVKEYASKTGQAADDLYAGIMDGTGGDPGNIWYERDVLLTELRAMDA